MDHHSTSTVAKADEPYRNSQDSVRSDIGVTPGRALRILVFLEASTIAGAVKPIFEFVQESRRGATGASVEVTMVIYRRAQQASVLMDAVRELGVAAEVIEERRAFDLRVLSQLRDLVRRLRPDIIWTNNTKSHFLVYLSGVYRAASWIAFHHGYTREAWRTRIYNEIDRMSLPRAKRVVTVCNDFAAQLQRRGVPADRLRVLRNPVNYSSPVAAAEKESLREQLGVGNRTILLSVGRLSFEKGHADLLRAVSLMRSAAGAAFDSYLVIVGDGPERRNLEALCSELKLNDVVRFTGFQSDVRRYYAIADIFVLPSHSEGSPNVLLEAMAADVPVVAAAVGGIPEVLSDQVNALLVPRQNIDALSAAIKRLLHEPALRMKLAEQGKDVVAQHTPQAYFSGVMALLNEVVA